ncbi:MAG: hypothetical protein RMY34_18175 [Aulosira sp. DedQUE10]|nr:hypothetical protein [Aulosira sp. DedQUE10]
MNEAQKFINEARKLIREYQQYNRASLFSLPLRDGHFAQVGKAAHASVLLCVLAFAERLVEKRGIARLIHLSTQQHLNYSPFILSKSPCKTAI